MNHTERSLGRSRGDIELEMSKSSKYGLPGFHILLDPNLYV